jgi:hypothetical protein
MVASMVRRVAVLARCDDSGTHVSEQTRAEKCEVNNNAAPDVT